MELMTTLLIAVRVLIVVVPQVSVSLDGFNFRTERQT